MEQTRVESWRTMEVEPIYQELAEKISDMAEREQKA